MAQGYLTQVYDKFFGKASAATGVIVAMLTSPVWPTRDYKQLAKEGYQKNWATYACINEIANAVASIDWQLFKGDEELTEHDLLRVLARPNPRQAGPIFLKRLMSFILISGNGYIEIVKPNREEGITTAELYAHRPDRMRIIPDARNHVGGYKYTVEGKSVTYTLKDMLHIPLFHPSDDFYGLSPIEVAARAIDSNTKGTEWNFALLKNMGRPSGAIKTAGTLEEDQRNQLKAVLAESQGSDNAGRPLLLEHGLEWQTMGESAKDMDWKEGQIISTRQICACFNVPPELIGDSASKTYASYPEARKAFYCETVLPFMDLLCAEFNNWLVPFFGEGLQLRYDRGSIEALREDRAKHRESVRQDVSAGILKIDEAREEIGYDALGGSSDLQYVTSSTMPLDAVSGEDFSGDIDDDDALPGED